MVCKNYLIPKKQKKIGEYFCKWIEQNRNKKIDKMYKKRMVPVMHSCGIHTLCNLNLCLKLCAKVDKKLQW